MAMPIVSPSGHAQARGVKIAEATATYNVSPARTYNSLVEVENLRTGILAEDHMAARTLQDKLIEAAQKKHTEKNTRLPGKAAAWRPKRASPPPLMARPSNADPPKMSAAGRAQTRPWRSMFFLLGMNRSISVNHRTDHHLGPHPAS
jgi:hypothetical protein